MELLDALQQIAQQSAAALSPAELVIGTVTAADPLEISVETAMDTLRAPVLYLRRKSPSSGTPTGFPA